MGLGRSVSRVGDLLYDDEGGHEKCCKPETDNDSANNKDCLSVSKYCAIARHTSIAINAGNTGNTPDDSSNDETISVD